MTVSCLPQQGRTTHPPPLSCTDCRSCTPAPTSPSCRDPAHPSQAGHALSPQPELQQTTHPPPPSCTDCRSCTPAPTSPSCQDPARPSQAGHALSPQPELQPHDPSCG